MSNLTSAFDVLRGWPNGSALSWDFKQKDAVTPDIVEGTVVAVEDESGVPVVDRWESALLTGNNLDHPWIVVQGADQYDGEFTGKLTCVKLRTGVIVKVATALTPTVGDIVWSDSDGVFTTTDPGSNIPGCGRVIEFNADEGWMVIES
jgi:hypothetical protein